MRVEILRDYQEKETLSELVVIDGTPDKPFNVFKCKGLEPPWRNNERNISCLPEGTYPVTKEETSPGHPYPHFRVHNVPGRSGILWHGGNFFKDTLGCYLPGDSFGDRNKDGILDVLNSRKTLQKLWDILPARFECTYKKKP